MKQHYRAKIADMRFMNVRIPLKDSDLDQKNDTIQWMKQNIEVMNQIIKNFYSLHSKKLSDKYLWQPYFSLEFLVEKELLKFNIGVPKDYIDTFEKTISSFIPGSIVDHIPQPKMLDAGKYYYGWYYVLSKDNPYPIKTYESFEADPMDSVISAFSKLDREEKLCFQLLASPLEEDWQHNLRTLVEDIKNWKSGWIFSWILHFFISFFDDHKEESKEKSHQTKLSQSQISDIEKKLDDEWFNIVVRALSVSPNPDRGKKIIWDLTRSLNQYHYLWLNWFSFLERLDEQFVKDFITRFFVRPFFSKKHWMWFIRQQILNIKELSSIYHFPHSRFNKNPLIMWQKFKIKPAPDNLNSEWILLGYNSYAWVTKEVRVSPTDRFRHFYSIWQTGTWKSTLLLVQAKQDLDAWRGFALIDPHGDLCEHMIKHYPKDRIEDLIYFDASDFEMPIWFNVFEVGQNEEEKDIIVNDLVEMFVQIYWSEIFWPRIQDYFRNGALTLMDQPDGGTMVEIVRLFVDDAFQKLKVKNVKNQAVRSWWDKTFASMWQREKQEMIPFFQSKFGPYTTTPIIRNIIWQPTSSFDMYEAMQSGKVILLNLSKWKMWELNSKLLWSLMVIQIKLAALRRARLEESERKEFFLYIDEFQNYITPSIETILSEARKYRLGLIVAHQYIEQLVKKWLWWEVDLRAAIFGNVWSIMSYKVWAKDAEYLEQEFSPEYSRTDLVNMDSYKGVIKLSVNTQPTRPFSLSVLNPYKDPILNNPDKVKIVKEISRLKWWRKKELVEKEIYFRIGA